MHMGAHLETTTKNPAYATGIMCVDHKRLDHLLSHAVYVLSAVLQALVSRCVDNSTVTLEWMVRPLIVGYGSFIVQEENCLPAPSW